MNRIFSALKYIVFFSLAVVLVGCGGFPSRIAISPPSNPTPVGPTVNSGAAERIYVIDQATNSMGNILQFPATASGLVSPTSMITPGTAVQQVGTDQYGNIFYSDGSIVEFTSGASGTPAVVRQITNGLAARICCIDGMAIGPDGTVVLGQDNGEVDVWSSKATGDVAPDRYILGNSEIGGGISPVMVANQVATDASGTIYIGAAGGPGVPEVVVYGPGSSGNLAPTRTIGPDGLAGGVAVDSSGDVYISNGNCSFKGTTETCDGSISIFAASTTSTTTPTRVIAGSDTQLGNLAGIKVDSVGNIYVISTDISGSHPTVLQFSATAVGNVAPTSSFTSTAWTNPGFNPSLAIY